jgi:uncharacterized protein (TIGR00255 family)
MTGFGSAERAVQGGRLRLEIRTVNHRYFNPVFKLPTELAAVEGDLRERLRQLLERGHVAVSARWVEAPAAPAGVSVDVERARLLLAGLKDLKRRLRLRGTPDLAFVARLPEVLTVRDGDGAPVSWEDVRPLVEAAAADVIAMRQREGRVLTEDLGGRLAQLERHAETIAQRAPQRLVAERDRLRRAVKELTEGTAVDEQRLAVEIALHADRLDISEELVRFRAHVAACRLALAGTAAVGKQLGFLAQEMLREVNTMGSKAQDAEIAREVIAMKGELEKFREQLENLE